MWVVIGVMLKLECRHPPSSINQIVSNAKYSETVVVTGGAIDVGYDMTQTLKKMDEKFILKPLELIR
jgi:hypothetical protein